METKYLERHHHFRIPLIEPEDWVARLEATVVDLLLNTTVSDESRDSSVAWELKHQAGVTQMARLLAARRNLQPDTAAVGALLHDVYVIVTGSYEDHAKRGGSIAMEMLSAVGLTDQLEVDRILSMVTKHSEKDIYESDVYTELGKDVDTLDCLLYPNAISEYLLTKPWVKVREYLNRAQNIWRELSLAVPSSFTILNDYAADDWFRMPVSLSNEDADGLEVACSSGTLQYPVLLIREESDSLAATTPAGLDWLRSKLGGCKAPTGLPLSGEQVVLWPHIRRKQEVPEWMTASGSLFGE